MTIIPILVRPQMGENIGAAARALANFGLSELRLVAPRDGWPNPKAGDMAGKALPVIDDAALFATTREAVADCQFVLATTARARAGNVPVMDARAAMAEVRARQARGEKCAVLFGPERTGLENEDIALADAVVSIPVAETYPSLNLAQAVMVVLYEWFVQGMVSVERREWSKQSAANSTVPLPLRERLGEGAGDLAQRNKTASPLTQPSPAGGEGFAVAPREELGGLFDQLEEALDAVNFWRVPEKKEVMWRNIRATLIRAGMNAQEIATWRGIVRSFK